MNAQEIVAFAEESLKELQEQQRELKASEEVWRDLMGKRGADLTSEQEALVARERARQQMSREAAHQYEVGVHARLQGDPNFKNNMRSLRQACSKKAFAQHLSDLKLTREQWDHLEAGEATLVPGERIKEFFWILGTRKNEWVRGVLPPTWAEKRTRGV